MTPVCACKHTAQEHDLDRRAQPCSVTPCDCTGYQHTHDLHVTRTTHLTAREGR